MIDNAFYDDSFLLLNHKAVEVPLLCLQHRPNKMGGLAFCALDTGECSVSRPRAYLMGKRCDNGLCEPLSSSGRKEEK
jgi:hypothetical protein